MSRLAVLLALAATLLCAPAAGAAPWRPFAPDSIWNLPLRADAPVAADSADAVAWLNGQIAAHGAWVNVTKCGMPFYWSPQGTPTVKVTLDHPSYMDPALVRAWSAVPIPPDAKPANCSDRNFAVLQQQPDGRVKEWEFWAATQAADGTWTAKWGGAHDDVRTDRGFASSRTWTDPTGPTYLSRMSTPGWNVTGASASMLGGVVTLDDLASGSIDHALAVALPDTAKGRWLWPAQRSDGGLTTPSALPEGAHLRIDPSLDLTTLKMTPLVRMLAEAAQRYGIVVRDRTFSSTVFYVQEPPAGAANPVPALLSNQWPDKALKAFPWDRLQLLAAKSCTSYSGCKADEAAVIDVDGPVTAGGPVRLDTTNSVLDHPRAAVRWDLDGDGVYETDAGREVTAQVTPQAAGPLTVGVQIKTAGGSIVSATRRLDVQGVPPAPAPVPPAPPVPTCCFTAPAPATPAAVAAAAAPKLTLSGAARRRVRAGRRLTLRGTTTVPGAIRVQRRSGRRWVDAGGARTVSGRVRWSAKMRRSARYRFSAHGGLASRAVVVRVLR